MADTAPNADSQPATAAGGGMTAQLSIEKIYIKDLSLENPGAPQSFQLADAPQIEIGLRTRAEQVAPDVYECVLTLTVTARSADKTVFLVEASQAGVFTIRGVPPNQMQAVLGAVPATACASHERSARRHELTGRRRAGIAREPRRPSGARCPSRCSRCRSASPQPISARRPIRRP